MNWKLSSVLLAIVASSAPHAVAAPAETKSAEFRPDVRVERLYKQQLDDVYYTTWFGRLEKSNGAWRDVYFETNEKFVNKGILSFNCTQAQADVGVILYDTGTYGNAKDRRVVRVRAADRPAWQKDQFRPLKGETPPYAMFLAAKKRFCAAK